MNIRKHQQQDIEQIASLYYTTVRKVNCRDYSDKHIDAWAPKIYDNDFWLKRFDNYDVYVIENDGVILGFCEYQYPGHIDCLYIHHEWQRQGLASKLLKQAEKQATDEGVKRLFADVCITAKPFFINAGFSELNKQNRLYQGLNFELYFMEKWLDD